jgi:hypothetical protein
LLWFLAAREPESVFGRVLTSLKKERTSFYALAFRWKLWKRPGAPLIRSRITVTGMNALSFGFIKDIPKIDIFFSKTGP